jgi:hypothetical protein
MSGLSLVRLLVGVSVAGAAVAAPARAETVLATEAAGTAVSAYGGRVAWWSVDPATNKGRLMTWAGARVARVPIAPVHKAYALDLGPTVDRHVAAVYARCDRHGKACDVYEYDFTTRREQRVKVASSPRVSEQYPTLWRRRIAFVEGASDRKTGRIVVAGLRGGSRHTIRGGPAGDPYYGAAQPSSLDLRGTAVSFLWTYERNACVDFSNMEGNDHFSQIWVVDRVTRRRIDSVCSNDGEIFSPALQPGVVGYLREDLDTDAGPVFRTRRLDGSLLSDVPITIAASASRADSASRDGTRLSYERFQSGDPARWIVAVQ